jgi:CheY-like chemotaxis protein
VVPVQPPARPHGNGLILLVDDEKEVRTVIREFLEQAGYEVLTAADGVEAVKVFEENADEITLVLLDVKMPRMDGEEAFGIMRGIRPDVRVVLSSGYGEQDAMQRFRGKGITGFVQKPYHAKALLARLHEILSGPESQ